jgi:TRAP-type C4-dicarboxylate transport system substrate-binding protein
MGEIYTALQAGVLDGMEHNPPTIVAGKYYETAKFYSLTEHIFSPLVAYLSNVTLNRMDPKLREGFADAGRAAAIDTRADGLAGVKEATDIMVHNGVSLVTCDREAFRKRVMPQTDSFLRAHPNAKPIIDIIRATA